MNFTKKFTKLLLIILMIGSSQNALTVNESVDRINFIAQELGNDVATFITKDGMICRLLYLYGCASAASTLSGVVIDYAVTDDHQYKTNNEYKGKIERLKKIVSNGLLITAYVSLKLKKFNTKI